MYSKIGMLTTHTKLAIVLFLILSLALTSCCDLGNYSDESDYYSYFDSVSYYKNYLKTDANMSDFYNEKSYDDTKIESSIEEDKYQALIISINKDINLSDFYIFFASSTSTNLSLSFYITDKTLETEIIKEKDSDDDSKEISITRFKSLDETPVLTTQRTLTQKFKSIALNKKETKVSKGYNLIILFDNNCDLDESNDSIFTFTNVLIRNENL